ncbi:hypothetical protein D915_010889, partial [Fasciola hepatica]
WYFACGEHARVQSLLSLLEKNQCKSEGESVRPPEVRPPLTTVVKDTIQAKKIVPVVSSSVDALSRFLLRGDTRDHAWPHLLATRQYSKAADILLEEGCKEIRFLGRRKLLFSLAKLAYLISDADGSLESPLGSRSRRDSALTIIELLLECIHMQVGHRYSR